MPYTMPAATKVAIICSPVTWRANFFSLASTFKSAEMIAAFSGGVKHCCGSSPTVPLNLLALFEHGQEFIELVVIRIFDDQFTPAFVSRLDLHMRSEIRAHFFLQALRVAA